MSCNDNTGKFRYFYTGNQVGCLNTVGDFNFVAGGPAGSGISAGAIVAKFFEGTPNRAVWQRNNAELTQELLNAAYPFIELNWIVDLKLSDTVTFRLSNRNLYVEDIDEIPRFYEARVSDAPRINISAGEWLSPNFEIGDLKISMNNRDGFFNQYLPQGENFTLWIGAEISVKVGFGEKYSNYFEVFKGFIPQKKGVETTLEEVHISAYDSFDNDEVPIPTLAFDSTNFPFADTDKEGDPLPLVYGDWTEEIQDAGDIPAFCSNAFDDPIISYVWNISQNSLREIGDIYLHRGKRKEDEDGPILLDSNVIVKEPENGRFLIPFGVSVLTEVYRLLENKKPALGSGLDSIIAETSETNFITLGVQVGDTVTKANSIVVSTVASVAAGALALTGGDTFGVDDSYTITTDKYVFRKGDRISVKCKGKNLEIMSVTRMADSGLTGLNPLCLSIGLNNSYWFADNDLQKIYELGFDGRILTDLDYADIDPTITKITGLDINFDNTLWIFENLQSKVYRYILDQGAVGLEFTTLSVSGLAAVLNNGGPLSIDDGNILTIVDNTTGDFYRINPFAGALPGLVSQFNRNDFQPLALDVVDIAADINLNQIIVMDRNTNSVYRVDESTGALVVGSTIDLEDRVGSNFTQARGVGYFIDGTIFFMNKQDFSITNFNESENASENPGFIARDILQSFAGKTTFDFDLRWNETSNLNLSQFRARVQIDSNTTTVKFINEFLQSFNTNMYLNAQKLALFYISFENFTTEGTPIREGDIKFRTFNPSKEYNQYFNTATGKINRRPFSGYVRTSDIYASPTGIQLAGGKEITKELSMEPVYRREDVDVLVPLFVRLAAAEPEFVNLNVGFRFLFTQLNSFYNINFKDLFNKNEISGRRFDDVPSFVRKIVMNLDAMSFDLKLWSLGTTVFGNYLPVGVTAGGQFDQIVLTNLGTAGYVSPIGTITGFAGSDITLEDVNAVDAENRSQNVVGLAWKPNYVVAVVDGATHEVLETLAIDSVLGGVVTTSTAPVTAITNTVKNSAGFIVGGHYLKYANFSEVLQAQTTFFGYYGKPLIGYPVTTTQEIEEQRSGTHNFDNGRLPYVLHPVAFVPN